MFTYQAISSLENKNKGIAKMNEEWIVSEEFYGQLQEILTKEQILQNEPLSRHTTFRIGGPATFLLIPRSKEEIIACVTLCTQMQIPFYILGNGSNILASDKGYHGVIIKVAEEFSLVQIEEENTEASEKKYIVTAMSGVLLSTLSKKIAAHGLTGFEFAEGIPGTLGGAVTMNAGAYDGEIKDCIVSATVIDREGNVLHLNKEELNLGYRKSVVQEQSYIVLEAVFEFVKGNQADIDAKMQDLKQRRKDKQPLEYPSAGSTFKRPVGYFAGKLIMDSELRGYTVGGAMISEKHCGFVINKGGATGADVRTLINHVIDTVEKNFGVRLETEVKFLGE